jgi:hypothetical protein
MAGEDGMAGMGAKVGRAEVVAREDFQPAHFIARMHDAGHGKHLKALRTGALIALRWRDGSGIVRDEKGAGVVTPFPEGSLKSASVG